MLFFPTSDHPDLVILQLGNYLIQVRSLFESMDRFLNNGGLVCPFYKVIWKAALPMKVEVFLWLTVKNKIHTGANLAKKGWGISFECSPRGADEEMVSHLFLKCSFARSMMNTLKIQPRIRG